MPLLFSCTLSPLAPVCVCKVSLKRCYGGRWENPAMSAFCPQYRRFVRRRWLHGTWPSWMQQSSSQTVSIIQLPFNIFVWARALAGSFIFAHFCEMDQFTIWLELALDCHCCHFSLFTNMYLTLFFFSRKLAQFGVVADDYTAKYCAIIAILTYM